MSALTNNPTVLEREELLAKGQLSPDLKLRLENSQRELSAKNLHVRSLQSIALGGALVLSGVLGGSLLKESTVVERPSLPLPRLLEISEEIQRIVPGVAPEIIVPIARVIGDVASKEMITASEITVSEVVAPVVGREVTIAQIPVEVPVVGVVGQIVADVVGVSVPSVSIAQVVSDVIVPSIGVQVVA